MFFSKKLIKKKSKTMGNYAVANLKNVSLRIHFHIQ